MQDLSQDKQIEEHIRKLFSNYAVPFSDEQKQELINNVHHLKLHSKKINIPIKEILLNKTFLLVIGSIIGVIVLIYIISHLSPSEKTTDKHTTISTDSLELNKKDSIHRIPSNNPGAFVTPKSNTTEISSKTKDTIRNEKNIPKKLDSALISQPLQLQKTDTTNKIPLKKKRKKRKRNSTTDEISNDPLSPISPKPPENNDNIKEEE